LLSGLFERFPNLKVSYAEGQIGWIPYVLERADSMFRKQPWTYIDTPGNFIREKASTYYPGHIYSCIFDDPVGVQLLDAVGADHVMFETDFPHGDTSFPHSEKSAAELFGHLDQTTVNKIARNNMIDLLHLDLARA